MQSALLSPGVTNIPEAAPQHRQAQSPPIYRPSLILKTWGLSLTHTMKTIIIIITSCPFPWHHTSKEHLLWGTTLKSDCRRLMAGLVKKKHYQALQLRCEKLKITLRCEQSRRRYVFGRTAESRSPTSSSHESGWDIWRTAHPSATVWDSGCPLTPLKMP